MDSAIRKRIMNTTPATQSSVKITVMATLNLTAEPFVALGFGIFVKPYGFIGYPRP